MDAVERLQLELARVSVGSFVRRQGRKIVRVRPYSYYREPVHNTYDYDRRGQYVEEQLRANSHLHTVTQYARGGKWGIWRPDRAAMQKKVVDELWDEQFSKVPSEGKAVMTGGLMGSGKTTIMRAGIVKGVSLRKYGRIDADMVKERMAKHGMIPKVGKLSPMEAATLVHEESAYLAAALADRAYAQRKNLIWDVSMVDSHTINSRMKKLRASGYKEVRGVFVDISPDDAWERVKERHRLDMELWGEGKGFGGRYVPERLVRRNTDFKWKSGNRRIFEQEKDVFDRYEVWDTSGPTPELISEGENPKPRENLGW